MSIRELTTLNGPSGYEDAVRHYILEKARAVADDVRVDKLGNVIATKNGEAASPKRVMACAHMDEVGFLITKIDDSGLLRFNTIGGMDDRILPSQRVLIGTKAVPGVIGAMPIHLLKPEDIKKPVEQDRMFIDIGATTRDQAAALVTPGDWAVFDSGYVEFGDNLIKAKALDDRAGCSLLLEALTTRRQATVVAVFSVMEEIGTVGSAAAAYAVKPDAAVVVEGTTCADMHGVPDHLRITRLGHGPSITTMDRSAISDRLLRGYLIRQAKEKSIPYQIRGGSMGGTDAGSIAHSRAGVPVVNISVPCRYIHSPISVMSREDYDNAGRLLDAFLDNIQRELEEASNETR